MILCSIVDSEHPVIFPDVRKSEDEKGQTRKRKLLFVQDKVGEKGTLGPCILKALSYFDVGRSFIADTLHNAYIGAFVRRLF
jgi:hypothetical protein